MYKSGPIQQCKVKKWSSIRNIIRQTRLRGLEELRWAGGSCMHLLPYSSKWHGSRQWRFRETEIMREEGEIGNKWPCRSVIRKRRPYLTGALIRQERHAKVEPSIDGSIQSIHQDTADSFKCIEPGEHVTLCWNIWYAYALAYMRAWDTWRDSVCYHELCS